MRSWILTFLLVATPVCVWAQGAPEIKFQDNMPTKDGFSADLKLNANNSIFEQFAPTPRDLQPVETVRRGVPLYTVILFANAALKQGRTDVSYDLVIKKPDGSEYGAAKNLNGWKNRPPAIPGLVHIAGGTVKIKIDPGDPAGKYTVEADIHDNAREVTIHCEQSFVVEE